MVKDHAVELALELDGPALLPQLAALFTADDEAWAKAVEAGLARGTWQTVAQVTAGLRRVPLDVVMGLITQRFDLQRDPGATPPAGDKPLFVLPIDVPSAVFAPSTTTASALFEDIRAAIYSKKRSICSHSSEATSRTTDGSARGKDR